MRAFEYASPTTKEQAVALLNNQWGETEVLAGGMDLLSLMKDDVTQPKRVVNIKEIKELSGLQYSASTGLRIGALVTLQELLENETVRKQYPSLAQAAEGVASPQIRNLGTVGGDLCQRPRCWYFRGGFGLLVAHGRAFLPAHLMGRGVTLINFFAIGGIGVMQFATGALVTANFDPGDPVVTSDLMWENYNLNWETRLEARFGRRNVGIFERMVLSLTIAVLSLLAVEALVDLPHHALFWFAVFDTLACGVFLWDVAVKLRFARDRLRWLWRWHRPWRECSSCAGRRFGATSWTVS